MLLSIIIPVYNKHSAIIAAVNEAAAIDLSPLECEIVVVCRGGSGRCDGKLDRYAAEITRFYSCPESSGKGTTVRIGLSVARGDVFLLQDADVIPETGEYHDLLAPILTGETAVVYGSRFLVRQKGIGSLRKAANLALTKAANALYHTNLTDMATPYKLFTSEAVEEISLRANGYDIEPEITAKLTQAGFEILEVPVDYRPRTDIGNEKRSWKDGLRSLKRLVQCRIKVS
jgi:glycosyltransferase involved in cell wall biosynthesis